MNDEQIKALLRELSDKAKYEGKSETVRIVLEPKEAKRPSRKAEPAQAEETAETEEYEDEMTESKRRAARTPVRPEEADEEEEEPRRKIGAGFLTSLSGKLSEVTKKRAPKERVFADVKAGDEAEPEAEEEEETSDTLELTWPSAAKGAKQEVKPQTAGGDTEAEEEEDAEEAAPTSIGALGETLKKKFRRPAAFFEPDEEDEEEEDDETEDDAEDAEDADDAEEAEEAVEAVAGDEIEEIKPESKSAQASAGETKEPAQEHPDMIPARKKKRETPVEPTEFESDAYLFRSGEGETEEDAAAQMPAFMQKAGAVIAGALGAVGAKMAAGKGASAEKKLAKAEAKAKAEAEAAQMRAAAADLAEPKEEQEDVKAEPEEAKAEQAESKAEQAEAQAEPAEAKAEQAEAEAEPAETKEREPEAEKAEPAQQTVKEEKKKRVRAPKEPKAPKEEGSFLERLAHKGIAGRELVMIAGGLILLVLLAALILSAVSSKKKAKNVTADEGLKVFVESEPSAWTKEADVKLSIHASSPIQSITVNDEEVEFSGEKKTEITVKADQPDLKVMVVSQEKVLNANVEIPMIDSTAPAVEVSIDGDQVTLNASDEGSQVEKLYYGMVEGLFNVPVYRTYTGPFTAESGKRYCYYAVDKAGNAAVSKPSYMIPATAMSVPQTSISLFPGEVRQIGLQTEPAGALMNNLEYTSSDEAVVTVTSDGEITAVSEGTADITISADGLTTITCAVSVHTTAQLTVTTLGDMTLGSDVNFSPQNSFDTVAAMYGTSYFMQNVKDILSADDLTFANFEGTLTTQGQRLDKQYAFRGDPSYTQILTDGSIDSVTLANNHSHDYGEISLEDTKTYLANAGIDYCIGTETIVKEVNNVKVGLVGIYTLDDQDEYAQLDAAMADVKEKGAQIIIAAFHWGTETYTVPDDMQKDIAHKAVDMGADLVVGHHPHVLQGIELYNGKYIAYSLGNFCFGGNTNPTTLDSMILQTTFTVGQNGELEDTQINIIPILVSSSTSWNNYQPTPAEGERAESILNNVKQLSADLGTNLDL